MVVEIDDTRWTDTYRDQLFLSHIVWAVLWSKMYNVFLNWLQTNANLLRLFDAPNSFNREQGL